MILPALALLSFGVGDLIRLIPIAGKWRTALAIAVALSSTWALAGLSGLDAKAVALTTIVALPSVAWLSIEWQPNESKPVWALALPAIALIGVFVASGSAAPIDGAIKDWYENLPFPFATSGSDAVSLDQFILSIAVFFFLLATGNRIVLLVLAAAKDSEGKEGGREEDGESELLKGGRFLGPMERLIVTASILSGNLAGAGFVIAAKGLLRFPEISRSGAKTGIDELTEYFLVGTFTSVLIAVALGILVLGAG